MKVAIVLAIITIAIIGIVFIKRSIRKSKLSGEERAKGLACLEKEFILVFVRSYERSDRGDLMFYNINAWKSMFKDVLGDRYKVEWDKLSAVKQELEEDKTAIFYTFPEPQNIGEAKYGIVLLTPNKREAAYFLLELSFNNTWVVTSLEGDGTHINYGNLELPPTVKNFAEKVYSLC